VSQALRETPNEPQVAFGVSYMKGCTPLTILTWSAFQSLGLWLDLLGDLIG
jgi:hypothetical protein